MPPTKVLCLSIYKSVVLPQCFVLLIEFCIRYREEIMIPNNAEEVMLIDMDPNQSRRESRSDDENCGRVQCASH